MPERQMILKSEVERLSHRDDPQTSRDAARAVVVSGRLSRQEQEVYECLKRHDRSAGYTAKELVYLMDEKETTRTYFKIQRRLSGLEHKGKVYRIAMRRNGCQVWRAI